ncbi:hypothetical protein Fleli_0826 [Bernardetia litoralis DSM 6794]|uniref:MAE-28990/MAE-18760-like HEPN domain-containing protein n=1 Tax=Bernardetia litoralis (strain ATCC 23117 / DSM 6794 / NBRC 15988 / NCIMB 1366 / Fx l1 / Sio-4) TaxID=880071 RepID=I4AH49_BERLS|nr:MAE_28990/MAE_18760 family HEPN-like nuclease [Bernardetia litoralis]AFM03284.1 hypothetical protein Fleli_0826 [Bernardetia litoralis DSM 6794]
MIFLEDYVNRVREINNYFEFIFIVDKSKTINLENPILKNDAILNNIGFSHLKQMKDYSINNELKKTRKANAYLLLYNLIEGSVTAGIDAIFLAINQSEIKMNSLTEDIRELYLDYSMTTNDEEKELRARDRKNLRKQFNTLIDKKVEFKHKKKDGNTVEGYKAYEDKVSKAEISGNIDSKMLAQLAKKYGFTLPTLSITNELSIIKNRRNQLAHGEITFSEAGNDKSIEEMIALKNAVTKYFNILMDNIKNYIENEDFKL